MTRGTMWSTVLAQRLRGGAPGTRGRPHRAQWVAAARTAALTRCHLAVERGPLTAVDGRGGTRCMSAG